MSAAARDDWRESYIAQGEQKQAQIDADDPLCGSNQCRMSSLVRHFGDLADAEALWDLRFLRARKLRGAAVPRRLPTQEQAWRVMS